MSFIINASLYIFDNYYIPSSIPHDIVLHMILTFLKKKNRSFAVNKRILLFKICISDVFSCIDFGKRKCVLRGTLKAHEKMLFFPQIIRLKYTYYKCQFKLHILKKTFAIFTVDSMNTWFSSTESKLTKR